jgi:hypothetical protein
VGGVSAETRPRPGERAICTFFMTWMNNVQIARETAAPNGSATQPRSPSMLLLTFAGVTCTH